MKCRALAAGFPVGFFLSATAASGGNISPALRYAYDANSGWIDFAPPISQAVTVGNYHLTGYAYAANYGWISFGNGPANKLAYSGTGTDQGVNVNPSTGALSGLAYAANIGWIQFGWAGANDPNRPRCGVNTGVFAGYAYSPNAGWINLSNLGSTSLAISDSDGDGMDDAWEMTHFGNLTAAGIGTDWDQDGQSDASEFTAGTLPKDRDSWLRITAYTNSAGATSHSLTFTCTNTRLYQVRTSTTLAPGSWVIAPTQLQGANEFSGADTPTMTVTCTQPSGSPRFFRIDARKF